MLPPGGVPQLLALAAVAALFGGVSAIERKGAFQLMLSRPLVLAALLGWALGDSRSGLMLGVPLELLFLGGVNLGGNIPDNESLLAAALTAMVVPAGRWAGTPHDQALDTIGLALLVPLALFGRGLERASERRNGRLFEAALKRAQAGDPDAARINLEGLVLPFVSTAAICAAAVLVSPLLALLRARAPMGALSALEGGWHAVWAVAAACAIRAIRDHRAPLVAAIAGVTVIAMVFAARGFQ
jgi:mannose/fructose/N-acetylgalactosamine-specific phosphotransferase system component IIC